MNSYDVNYLLNQLNNSVKPVTEQNHMIFHKPNTMSINEQKISTILKPVTEKEIDSLFKQKTENDTINTIFRPNTEKEADSVFKSITEQKILTEKKQIKQNKNNNYFTEQKTVTEKKQNKNNNHFTEQKIITEKKQNKYNDFFSEQSDTLVKNKNTDTSKSEKTLLNSLNKSIFEPKKKQIEKLLKNNKNLIESINKDLATESKNDNNNNDNNVNSFNNIITEIKKNDSNFNNKIIDNYKS